MTSARHKTMVERIKHHKDSNRLLRDTNVQKDTQLTECVSCACVGEMAGPSACLWPWTIFHNARDIFIFHVQTTYTSWLWKYNAFHCIEHNMPDEWWYTDPPVITVSDAVDMHCILFVCSPNHRCRFQIKFLIRHWANWPLELVI